MEKFDLGVRYYVKADVIEYEPKEINKISRLLEEKVPYVISVHDLFDLCEKNEIDDKNFFNDTKTFINWIEGLGGLRDISEDEYWGLSSHKYLKLSDYLMVLFENNLDLSSISFGDLEPIDMYPVSKNILKDHSLAKDAYDYFFYTYDHGTRTVRYVKEVLN